MLTTKKYAVSLSQAQKDRLWVMNMVSGLATKAKLILDGYNAGLLSDTKTLTTEEFWDEQHYRKQVSYSAVSWPVEYAPVHYFIERLPARPF